MEEIIRKRPSCIWWDTPLYFYNYMRPGSQTELHSRPERGRDEDVPL